MAISPGTRLGPYEIVSALGAGGMGEVYRARDTRLGRDVAIKVLPAHLASNADLRLRLEREARAISGLNHPHICILHDIGHQDGMDFLVMEYLEGESLAQRVERGPLPLDDLLRFAIEIADALDKAHRNGLIHRDLKPGNIMLTKSGSKLLDFGLAKTSAQIGGVNFSSTSTASSPALGTIPSKPLTAEGKIVGTFQYMAPEQLEGKDADARSDIFAFGAVLYEMATSRRAFEGKSQATVIAAIIEREPPPISQVAPMSPPALGRPLLVIPPDGSPTSNRTIFDYSGNVVTVTDPTGKARKSTTDALGRLVQVNEPDPASGNTLTLVTTNAYDVLDRLTQITPVAGAQTRTYNYDGLGRLTSNTTPEAGTWNYTYNVYNQVATRTDARGVITTYAYDTLNRPTSVSYNVGTTGVPATATVSYFYDEGGSAANALGRLTHTTDGVGSETYTYDLLGRATQVQKVISGTTYTTNYAYNLASELTSITYPSGRQVQQSYDVMGRLSTILSGSTTYASGFGYNLAGQVTTFNYGNGVTATLGYTAERLQLQSLSYTKPGQTLLSLSYGYTQGGGNNGQIASITDSTGTQEAGRSVTYTYDSLYRLSTAVTTGSTSYPQWGLSWTYDRYGNRTNQTQTAGSPPPNSMAISATTNRITETWASYDANGNLTNDGLNTMVYDAESRLVSSTTNGNTVAYTLDGASLRVKKVNGSTTTVYIFSGSKVTAEYANGSLSKEYIYSGGQLLATHEGATLKYQMSDHLSTRITTDTSGNVVAQSGHYPYGENWYETGGTNKLKFTSYERDTGVNESGNDYAMMRTHISRLGRFNAPDPIAGSPADPQSLNRYAYTRNDPVNLVDPLGLNVMPVEACADYYRLPDDGHGGNIVTICWVAFYINFPDDPDVSDVDPGPGGGYDPKKDFRDYAVQLSNGPNMSDCEKLARLVFKAGQAFGPILGVEGLLNGLTEIGGPFGGSSDPQNRVGVLKSDPNYANSFGSKGFLPPFVDTTPGSENQVRHFAGWFAAGYFWGDNPTTRGQLYANEKSRSTANPDVALGLAALSMGSNFGQLDYPLNFGQLAQDIWHLICGGKSNLSFQ